MRGSSVLAHPEPAPADPSDSRQPYAERDREGQPRRIAVVGGAGYIGSCLCRLLLDRGFTVLCIDALWFGDDAIGGLLHHPRFELCRLDLRDPTGLQSRLEGCDSVVHLAGLVGDGACNVDAGLTRACNYEATVALARCARSAGIERFVFASSCSVYGCVAAGQGAREDDEPAPLSLYARDKLLCERALVELADSGFHPTSLRLATVFGWSPRMRFDLVANLFTAQAVQGQTIRVFGGSQWRPLVHVGDVARAFAAVLAAPRAEVSGQAFNVGSSADNVKIVDLARMVCEVVPRARMEQVQHVSDSRDYRVDFRRFGDVLGFAPAKSLARGIDEIARQLAAQPDVDIHAARYVNETTTRRVWLDERCDP